VLRVSNDGGYWSRIEEYVSEHPDAAFSHGICPDCREKRYLLAAAEIRSEADDNPEDNT
jgi:hypothetical protein